MYTLSIRVRQIKQIAQNEKADQREEFWENVLVSKNSRIYADNSDVNNKEENNFRNNFARNLTAVIERSHLRDETFRSGQTSQRPWPRFVFQVVALSYGSLKIDLGVPNIDEVLTAFENNVEVLEAILGSYVPQAFSETTGASNTDFSFNIQASEPLLEYARFCSRAGLTTSVGSNDSGNARKGAKVLAEIVRSPLVFPVLLVLLIWFLARADILAERQIQSELTKTLLQQQTETMRILKDAAIRLPAGGESQVVGPSDSPTRK